MGNLPTGFSPFSKEESRYPTNEEKNCRCADCNTTLVCEAVVSMGQKTSAFMKRATGKETVTAYGKLGVNGHQLVKGEFLITYMRNDGKKFMCTDCFKKAFPTDFKGILLTAVGKGKVINSEYKWFHPSYGME